MGHSERPENAGGAQCGSAPATDPMRSFRRPASRRSRDPGRGQSDRAPVRFDQPAARLPFRLAHVLGHRGAVMCSASAAAVIDPFSATAANIRSRAYHSIDVM